MFLPLFPLAELRGPPPDLATALCTTLRRAVGVSGLRVDARALLPLTWYNSPKLHLREVAREARYPGKVHRVVLDTKFFVTR